MVYPSPCWQLRKYVIIVKWYVLMFSSHWLFKTIFYYWNYYNRFTALCTGQPGWDGTRRNIHPLTYPDHYPTFISFFHVLRFVASSLFNLCAPHTAYISIPSQCLLFEIHAHAIAACFAVVPRLYHIFLVCLSTLCPAHVIQWSKHLGAMCSRALRSQWPRIDSSLGPSASAY